jgi:hypothetical protein
MRGELHQGAKIFWIMKEKYRNRLKKYDRISDIICGVVN